MIGRRVMLPILNLGVGAVLGLIALKFTALYFGKGFLGDAANALAFLGVIYVFTDLSMGEAHVKHVSEGEHAGDCFATYAVYKVVSTAAFVLISVGIFGVYLYVLDKPLTATTPTALAFALAYYVAKSVQSIAQSTFEARLEAARSQIMSFVETVVRTSTTLAIAFAFAAIVHKGGPLVGRIDPGNPVWAWVVAHPGGALTATYALGCVIGAIAALGYLLRVLERGRFRRDLLRSYFRFAIPLFAISGIAILAFFIDRIALGLFFENVDTGDFEGPRRLVSVLEGVGGAAGLLLFPSLSAMLARGDRAAALSLVDRSIRYLSMVTLPIVAFLIVFPVPVIRLTLDNEWVGNSAILGMLAVSVYLATITRPHINLLMGANKPAAVARIGVVAAGLHIVLNLVLIPDDIKSLGLDLPGLAAMGAALATLISGTLYYVLVVLATKRLDGYSPPSAILKHVVAGAVMVGALLALDTWTTFHLGRWYTFFGYVPLGALVYAAALVGLRELTRSDWAYIQDTLHPGEMWRYVRGELGRGKPR